MNSCNSSNAKYTSDCESNSKHHWRENIRLSETSNLRGLRDTKPRKRLQHIQYFYETNAEAASRRAKDAERKRIYRKLKKNQQNAERAAQGTLLPTIRINSEVKMNLFKHVDSGEIAEYKKLYPKLENITDRPVHCTSCNSHIGTAPISEAIIKMHPLLRVIQCKNCYTFYTSGEFVRGADGSEYYCRWCGQGGEVFCCSKCPKVFCRRCIEHNVSKTKVDEIQNNDNWICFACDPACILQLRADYWALLNFIEKQKKTIGNSSLTEKQLNDAMSNDCSKCCLNVMHRIIGKRKLPNSTDSTSTPLKRTDIDKSLQEPSVNIDVSLVKQAEINLPIFQSTSGITGMSSSCDTGSPTSMPTIHEPPPHKLLVQPLNFSPVTSMTQSLQTLSQSVQTPAHSVQQNLLLDVLNASTAKNIVFHTNNGFRVDLNRTGDQETYLLQNGKLILVEKKQPPLTNVSQISTPSHSNVIPSIITTPIVTTPSMENPVEPIIGPPGDVLFRQVSRIPSLLPLTKCRPLLPQPSAPVPQRNILPILQNPNILPVPNKVLPEPTQIAPKTTTKKKKRGKPKLFQNSVVDKAKALFEIRVKNSLEVCQHIIGKLRKLTKSTPFKSINTVTDVKDLIMHLSYLLTYGSNRFKTLQDKFLDDMRIMGLAPDSVNSDDDDVEILEPKTTLIVVDSDENDATDSEQETRKVVEHLINVEKLGPLLDENYTTDSEQETRKVVEHLINVEKFGPLLVENDLDADTPVTGDTSENHNSRKEQVIKTEILSSDKRDTEQNMKGTIFKENITNPMKINEEREPIIDTVAEIVIKYESKCVTNTFDGLLEKKAKPDEKNDKRIKDIHNETNELPKESQTNDDIMTDHINHAAGPTEKLYAGAVTSRWNTKSVLLRQLLEKGGFSRELNKTPLLKTNTNSRIMLNINNIDEDLIEGVNEVGESTSECAYNDFVKSKDTLENSNEPGHLEWDDSNSVSTQISEHIKENNLFETFIKEESRSETDLLIDLLGKD